jgi:hypothetical protein
VLTRLGYEHCGVKPPAAAQEPRPGTLFG